MKPFQILRLFEYELQFRGGRAGVFVLGSVEDTRVTVISQQHRALSLVHALFNGHPPRAKKGDSIGIVGAGVAGLTAAVAAHKEKAKITLFERQSEILSLFATADHRWLHSGLFNWPQIGWNSDPADTLPFLRWKFGPASRVAASLKQEFESYQRNLNKADRIQLELGNAATFAGFTNGERADLVQLRDQKGQIHSFQHLIVATGFGSEPSTQSAYWKPDNFAEQCNPTRDFVVVGTGDGGLIDCLRLRLRGSPRQDDLGAAFTEKEILSEILDKWDVEEREKIEEEIRAFEWESRQSRDAVHVTSFYSNLHCPNAAELIKRLLRTDTRVWLIGRQQPRARQSCPYKPLPI
jgi:thioredoxin reductase